MSIDSDRLEPARDLPPIDVDEIARILKAVDAGDTQAAERLLPLAYNELRRMAADKMKGERAGHTLQPTALVHEVYLRLRRPGNGTAAGISL